MRGMNDRPAFQRPLIAYAAVVVLALGGVYALHQAADVLVPIALAVLIWFLINALAAVMRAAPGVGGLIGVVASKALAALIFLVLIAVVGRMVVDNLVRIGADLDPENSPLVAALLDLAARFGAPVEFSVTTLIGIYPFEDILGAALTITRNLISDASLVILYVLFLLLDEPFFDAKLRALQPDPKKLAALKSALGHVAAEARVYLWLMFLISLGVGVITFAVSSAFGLQGAAFWGLLAFGLNFIPTIGSILAVAIPGTYALVTFTDPVALTAMIALLALTQFVAGEIVMPRMMGAHLNLSAFVVLLALVAWGALWGPVGMFLGIPITVIAMLVFARFRSTRFIAVLLSKDGDLRNADGGDQDPI